MVFRMLPAVFIVILACGTLNSVAAQPEVSVQELVESADAAINSDPAQALRLSRQALELAQEQDDDPGAAASRVAMAEALEALGGWDESLSQLDQAMLFYQQAGDISGQANVLDLRAGVLMVKGEYEAALSELQQAYDMLADSEEQVKRAEILNSMGRAHYFQDDTDRALKYFERSRAMHEEAGNLAGVGTQLNNIGVMHRINGESEKALEAYQRSIEIRRQLGNLRDMAGTYNNIGVVHFEREEYDKALEWAHKALEIRQQVGYRLGEAQSFYNIGRTLVDIGRTEEGIDYMQRSLEITDELEALQLAQISNYDLSDALARIGRYEDALEALHRAWDIRNQRFDLERQREVEAMNVRFETAERDREIALLEEQRRRDTLLRNSAIGGAILLILLIILLYNRYRLKTQANQLIADKNDELAALNRIVATINSRKGFGSMLSVLVQQAVKFVDKSDRGAILIRNYDTGQFHVASSYGYRYEDLHSVGLDHDSAIQRYTVNGMEIAPGVYLHESLPPLEGHHKMAVVDPLRSVIAMSITIDDQVEGFMILASSSEAEAFQTSDAARFARIREHAISALTKARHLERLRKENERAEEALRRMREAEAELKHAAMTDTLTDLPNRRYLFVRLKDEIARSRRNRKSFSLIMSDIDHFKSINDTHGHDFGDEVLIHVSRLLTATLRGQDVVCRWGGEEFLVMLPETELEGALVAAEKLRTALESGPHKTVDGEFPVTMTFGVTQVDPEHDAEQRIKHADAALYEGKLLGRNRVVNAAEVVVDDTLDR